MRRVKEYEFYFNRSTGKVSMYFNDIKIEIGFSYVGFPFVYDMRQISLQLGQGVTINKR